MTAVLLYNIQLYLQKKIQHSDPGVSSITVDWSRLANMLEVQASGVSNSLLSLTSPSMKESLQWTRHHHTYGEDKGRCSHTCKQEITQKLVSLPWEACQLGINCSSTNKRSTHCQRYAERPCLEKLSTVPTTQIPKRIVKPEISFHPRSFGWVDPTWSLN